MTPDEKRDYYSQAGRSLPAGTRYSCIGGFAVALEPLKYGRYGLWSGRVRRPDGEENEGSPSGRMVDWDSVPDQPNAGCPAPGTTVQKYHHGPCNEHCRCGKVTPKHRCSACNLECEPGDLYTDGTKVFCSESCRDFGKVTKPARRFCACGQEIGERALAAFEWDDDKPDGTQPLCGDCLTQNWRYGADRSKSKGLDTRIAAARAVTDEAEGAWSTATSEGP